MILLPFSRFSPLCFVLFLLSIFEVGFAHNVNFVDEVDTVPPQELIAPKLVPSTYCFSPNDFAFAINMSAGQVHLFDNTITLPYPPDKDALNFRPAGHTRLSFTIMNLVLARYVTWSELKRVHDMKTHVLFVSEDAETFGHVHVDDFSPQPKPEDTIFEVHFDFRRSTQWYVKFEIAVTVPACIERHIKVDESDASSHHHHHYHHHSHNHSHHLEKRDHTAEDHHHKATESVTLETSFKVRFASAKDSDLVAVSPKKLSPKEIVYGFPVYANGTHVQPIPLAQLQSQLRTSDVQPGFTYFASPHVYQFVSPRLAQPIPRYDCTPVYFHVSMNRHPHTHPVDDLELLLDASAHVTLFHSDSGSFVHVHGEQVASDQVPPQVLQQVSEALDQTTYPSTIRELPILSSMLSVLGKRSTIPKDLCAHAKHHHHHHHVPGEKSTFGPWFGFPLTLYEKGWWRMMIQTKRKNIMIVPSFWIQVI